MSLAIISDIHGNADALRVVLNDIEQRDIIDIVCLGDIVGYGPDPVECLDLVREHCRFALMGNHDFAVLFEPTNFNTSAQESCFWTRRQFEIEPDAMLRRLRYEYLGNLTIRRRDDIGLWVHASPRRPINEYVFPDDVINAPLKMQQLFDRVEHVAFCGHTHVTGVFTDEPDFYPPSELGNNGYHITPDEKCIINPGSVGQPRDRDPRASYAILDDNKVQFVRVAYDVDAVARKIQAVDELSNFLGQRLFEGR